MGNLILTINFPRMGFHYVVSMAFLATLIFSNGCIEDKVEPKPWGTIEGTAIDIQSGQPLKDVEIVTAPPTHVVYTNQLGQFSLSNISSGEYTVIPKFPGYSVNTQKIMVVANGITALEIKLTPTSLLAPIPYHPRPSNQSIDQSLDVTLTWRAENPSKDKISYVITVYESTQQNPLLKVSDHLDTLLALSNLKYNTLYFWQVQAKSSTGNTASGDMWVFKTLPFPDNRIVYTSKATGNYEIYSSDETGATKTIITTTENFELKPLYSPQRDLIAFSSNAQIDFHIYLMKKDGAQVQKVTALPIAGRFNQGIGYSWSPDGGKFIYSHYATLYRIDRDGTNLAPIAIAPPGREFRGCDWTDVNNKIVVETMGPTVYTSEIYLMNADGTDTLRLVDNLPGIMENPTFSIDGQEVMFTQDVSGFESATGRQLNAHIFTVDIVTQAMKDLSISKPDGTNDLQPRYSPDGAKIIFVNAPNDGSGSKSIWMMDVDGRNRKKLFDNAEMPHWK